MTASLTLTAPAPSPQDVPARRLVAVLHGDMAGYSRLIAIDAAGTLQRFRSLRDEVITPAAATYGGRMVHLSGDEFLLEFGSATQAVSCAVWLQQQIRLLDKAPAPALRMQFRIGVDIGEVLNDGSDIHGEGVNIAARLQAVAPAGGVYISRTVRDQITGCLDLRFRPIGKLRLKNIARTVEAFSIEMPRPHRGRFGFWRRAWREANRGAYLLRIGLVIFLAVAPDVTGSAGADSHIADPVFGHPPALPRLSVVVLPVENRSAPAHCVTIPARKSIHQCPQQPRSQRAT